MFTNRARQLVIAVFILVLLFGIYEQVYEITGAALLAIGILLWGYFKEGTVILAAKDFHDKNYEKTEALLNQVARPHWLAKKRRGYYEYMMGGISLQKQDFEAAEQHYEIAVQFPLRSVNDHVAALVHVANISLRQHRFDKAEAYLSLAKKQDNQITARMREVITKLEREIKQRKI
ncbi:tetratricopeptide repeat protein [Mucilaginibacter arboris]|uniref:Tetratricopeptide repeat protein n=1 Tax=Mucilaginibacter arboris TaxID=2682090 RepID=A0A7K1STF0_9SPHI|nr:tetratricopeptide repeat protein [Mucilaginibacter arboris]MVN20586.1 tetratricopeptide repeat protein [Mucilaginibacter arboris]